MSRRPTIGILTGGGDCPGLNAVIRAATKSAIRLGYDVVGFLRGYEGLVDPVNYMPLDVQTRLLRVRTTDDEASSNERHLMCFTRVSSPPAASSSPLNGNELLLIASDP